MSKRSVGVQTFWFQAVSRNHIVRDAVEVVNFSRKHTAIVCESVAEIRGIIASLVEKHDARRDGLVPVVKKSMETRLGSSSDEVLKVLAKQGIRRTLEKETPEVARTRGAFTIFAVVDTLARISGKRANGARWIRKLRPCRRRPSSCLGSEATHHRASPLPSLSAP